MAYNIYPNIEELTRPETLQELVQHHLPEVCLTPFETRGWSSTESQFLGVGSCNGAQPAYIIKRLRREKDWVMGATDDRHWRAVTIWQQGLLDQLPPEIDHGIIACSLDKEGYAILMHNVADSLIADGRVLSAEDNHFVLDAMAALHTTFWEKELLQDPALNLCSPELFFTHTAPKNIRRIRPENSAAIIAIILEGWQILPQHVEADVVDLLRGLADDPIPLCTALERYPQTLVHGDWRNHNFGVRNGEQNQVVLLDWARPLKTGAAVDFAWYLATSDDLMPTSCNESIERYKKCLALRLGQRFDESWWQPQLELSLLGAFLMHVCFHVWFMVDDWSNKAARKRTQESISWWSEQARIGAAWLA